jgi:hypothetical protein
LELFIAALVIFLPVAGKCAWVDAQGKTIPDTPSMRSSDELGVRFVLTASEREFRQRWSSTAGTPKLQSTTSIQPGESISGVLVFSGCEPGLTRSCNVDDTGHAYGIFMASVGALRASRSGAGQPGR